MRGHDGLNTLVSDLQTHQGIEHLGSLFFSHFGTAWSTTCGKWVAFKQHATISFAVEIVACTRLAIHRNGLVLVAVNHYNFKIVAVAARRIDTLVDRGNCAVF